MADVMRYRWGARNEVLSPVDSATVIEVGDLIYIETDDARPASALADQGTESANQAAFHDSFAGVAMQASANGETAAIRIATSGVFEYACLSATFEITSSSFIGVDEDGTGTALEDQVVVAVATPGAAIGHCARRVNPAATSVLVEIVSTVLRGGPQAMA